MSVATAFETMAWGPAPLDAAPARAWIEGLRRGRGPEVRATSGDVLTRLPTAAEMPDGAAWAALDPAERGDRLAAWAGAVGDGADLVAALGALEAGAAVAGGLRSAAAIADALEDAGWLARLRPDGVEPVGLVAVPWSDAGSAAIAAAALAAGCSVCLRAAEGGVLGALWIAEAARDAGVPLSVLPPGAAAPDPAVPGSPAVTAEAHAVLGDADLDAAAGGIAAATCGDGRGLPVRVVAAEAVAGALGAALAGALAALRTGDPLDRAVDLGVVPNPAGLAALAALPAGAVVASGDAPDGCVPPTLVAGPAGFPALSSALTGPVVVLGTARTAAEAVAMAGGPALVLWGGAAALPAAMAAGADAVRLDDAPDEAPTPREAMAPFLRVPRPDARMATTSRVLVAGRLRAPGRADVAEAVAAGRGSSWGALDPRERLRRLTDAARRLEDRVAGARVALMAALGRAEQVAPLPSRPLGVVAALCPDEAAAASAVGAILAAGSTAVIVGPDEALALGRALGDAGIPQGALAVLTGPHEPIAEALAAETGIAAIWALSGPAAEAAARRGDRGVAVRADLGEPGDDWVHAARRPRVLALPGGR